MKIASKRAPFKNSYFSVVVATSPADTRRRFNVADVV